MDAITAENLSRKAWFAFELEPVTQIYANDWVRFYHEKKEKEDARRAEWEKRGPHLLPDQIEVTSYDQMRAAALLQEEFERVVKKQADKAYEVAEHNMMELKRENYHAVAENCVMYSADSAERIALTVDYLKSQRTLISEVLAIFERENGQFPKSRSNEKYPWTKEGEQSDSGIFWEPDPWAGMPAKALISIGTEGHEIELWWSGPVMPNANGPRYATPQGIHEYAGRWSFYNINSADTKELWLSHTE